MVLHEIPFLISDADQDINRKHSRKEEMGRRRSGSFTAKSLISEESLAGVSDDRRVGDSRVAAGARIYEADEHSELSNRARRATYPTHRVKKLGMKERL